MQDGGPSKTVDCRLGIGHRKADAGNIHPQKLPWLQALGHGQTEVRFRAELMRTQIQPEPTPGLPRSRAVANGRKVAFDHRFDTGRRLREVDRRKFLEGRLPVTSPEYYCQYAGDRRNGCK